MQPFSMFQWGYIFTAFLFHLILLIHFALRKWRFDFALRYGWIVYALSLPAAGVSLWLMMRGKPWWSWLGGWLYLVWGIFGYVVEYRKKIEWRAPILWPVFGPYITLYLATVMFYWWPLALIWKPLWYGGTVLFCVSTFLNITSHRRN
jgi:hypothetical protein